jgi:hypothetical protein
VGFEWCESEGWLRLEGRTAPMHGAAYTAGDGDGDQQEGREETLMER